MSCKFQAENERQPPLKCRHLLSNIECMYLFFSCSSNLQLREVNASCCRPDLDEKCAVGCSLTVNVPVIPLALHSPVGQELEVMSAIHAVQTSHPPVVPQQVAGHSLILGCQHLSVRHPAPTAVAPTGGTCRGAWSSLWEWSSACVPLRWSGVHMLVNERRDQTGRMRVSDSWSQPTTGIK